MKILHFHKSHINAVVELTGEFDEYLQYLSSEQRDIFDYQKQKEKLLKYGFGKEKSFSRYIAKVDGEIVGYVFYHYGFDPDEMQGKVIHLIDFFVSESARGQGAGRALIEKLQSHTDSIGIYFGVWKKNLGAIEFYKKMGAEWCEDVPYMKIMK